MSSGSPLSAPPSAQLLGWRLVADHRERGELEIAFHPDERMLNPHGTIQGGIVAAMLDETMGLTLLAKTDGQVIASMIDLHVSFVRPAKLARVLAKGRVVHQGRSIAFLEAELFDEAGTLLARATSSAIPMAKP